MSCEEIEQIKSMMHQVYNYPWLPRTIFLKDRVINCDYGPDKVPKFGKDGMTVHSLTNEWLTVRYDDITDIA